jgi:tRNA(Ile)-lysidine synthase
VSRDLRDDVAATDLLSPGRPVLLLLSGGRDSVCLIDVAVRIVGAAGVRVLHVNYALRAEADGDEEHCRALCQRLGLELVVRRAGPVPEGNLQAWARRVRYAAAQELAPYGDIATGHTATDQVETILYRLASSPSRRALLGMRPREGRLIRPLLRCTRADTAGHCELQGLGWRDDASNAQHTYARSRVRHGLVPALEAVHPGAQANVSAVAEILRLEAEVLDELVNGVLRGQSEIALPRLRALPAALRRLVVQRLADDVAGRPAAGVGRRAEEVAELPARGRAALDLPGGVRATVEKGILRFVPTPPVNAGPASRTSTLPR